ncbi:MAG: hypothetical protein H6810_12150 [Phycisphaeraceae bacterium]|nr:MAG: hypothetical protein H6810_12150 [Phycisphaeraceae bacterium]
MKPIRLALGILLASALLTGCTTDLNARTTIGTRRALPAFEAADAASPAISDGPTTRLDRADWEPVEFRLPVDGTAHNPLWLTQATFDDDPARQQGLYPTAESSLQLGESVGSSVRKGFVEPVRVLFDLFTMPARMVVSPPWKLEQSPSMSKRWHAGEWLAGPLPDSAGGAADRDASGDGS